jgi:hypothetical protein
LTLVEVLISISLLGLMMGGVYATLVLSMRYQRKLSDSVDTFQQAVLATGRISQALGTGAQASIVVEPDGFAFVSAQPKEGPFTHTASGQLEWHKYVFFFIENGSLYRGELPLPAPTITPPVPPALSVLRADTAASKLLVAEGVELLEMTTGSGATTRLKIRGKLPGANFTTVESRVTFRQ